MNETKRDQGGLDAPGGGTSAKPIGTGAQQAQGLEASGEQAPTEGSPGDGESPVAGVVEPTATGGITGVVEKLVFGGNGLIRHEGKAVMTPLVAPGELVEVRLVKEHPQWAEAALVEVRQPSAERVEAPCPVFSRCGGCQYQHLNYPFQLEQKRLILLETLARVGKLKDLPEVDLLHGEPWGYRNRVQVHLDGARIGFRLQASRRLVPVDACPIASPALNAAIGALRQMAREPRFPRFVESVELFSNERETLLSVLATKGGQRHVAKWFIEWCAERIPGASQSALVYDGAGCRFQVGHRSFFQTNRFLVDALVERVLRRVSAQAALDLYSGVGLFAIPLARRGARVTAVESSASAIRDLETNAANHGARVDAVRASVDAFLPGQATIAPHVFADPPRAGLGKMVVQDLVRLKPARITLVSCDPATLARDLSALGAGGYRVEALTLVDLFPQTAHIETVCDLALQG
ncbi:MAG: class I SAM-dependent RNA methyltransferase [Bryobacterales bacterium]|jgi:23S rRNA (uracil1939-C5)-methyltransferase|nr:class I SAM-dependent RNA methyltransferase [Bryobacterales bacterium]